MKGWLRNRFGRTVAVGTLAVAGVGGLAYGLIGPMNAPTASTVANLQSTGTSGSSSCTPGTGATTTAATPSGAKAAGHGRALRILRKLLARTDHATLTVCDKSGQWVTVEVDRGTVKAVSTTSITILRPDGGTVTAPVNSSTKFLRRPESSVVVGQDVVVVQEGGAARYVIDGRAAGGKSGKAAGKGAATSAISVT